MKRLFIFCLLISSLCASPQSWAASPTSSFALRPITEDVFYFILMDRFADGDPSNNKAYDKVPVGSKDAKADIARHGYEPSLEDFYHGGDFAGIIQKLDYLQGLGVTALWLSPVQKNRATQFANNKLGVTAGYHGYWIQDFTTVDPHWGKEADFVQLIEEAHKRGMKVFIDVIVNHTADMISYRECQECAYRSRADFPYAGTRKGKILNQGFRDGDFSAENFAKFKDSDYAYSPFVYDPKLRKVPDWLNDPIYYHNRGNSTFSGENSELGDFFGLDDLFTEHPRVVSGMIDIYADWIKKYKFDGFRIDTVKHVNIEFWQEFIPAMRQAAKDAGVPHFFMFGEVFSGDPLVLSRYTREGKFDSVLDFSLQGAIKEVFADGQPANKLHETLANDDLHRLGSSPEHMMSFVSNHDIGRLALALKKSFKDASDEELVKRLSLAHAYLYFSRGVPVLYYGDEQGFTGFGNDKGAREDMFPSKTPSYAELINLGTAGKGTPAQDNFDTQHPLYKAFATFAQLRKQEILLQSGDYHPLTDLPKGLLGFRRTLFDSPDEVLVVFNLDSKNSLSLPLKGSKPKWVAGLSATAWESKQELVPLSYLIIKRAKTPTMKSKPQGEFANLLEGQRVAGMFYGELKLAEAADYKVVFYRKGPKDKDFVRLYTDTTAPYRAYIDGEAFPDGTELNLKAEVSLRSGVRQELFRKVIVDKRPIHTKLIYENGNQRTEAQLISREGRIQLPRQLEEGQKLSFDWPLGTSAYTIFFSGLDTKQERAYDKPLVLNYRTDVLPYLKQGPQGEPTLTLYINSKHEMSYERLAPTHTKPEALRALAEGSLPSKKLFVRGGMNAWQAKDELSLQGKGIFRADTQLSAGFIEFKVSDADWSSDLNFGAPVDENGLSASGQSSNLSLDVAKEGVYRFELFSFSAGEQSRKLTLLRVSAE